MPLKIKSGRAKFLGNLLNDAYNEGCGGVKKAQLSQASPKSTASKNRQGARDMESLMARVNRLMSRSCWKREGLKKLSSALCF
jgi:hypothetical protein